MSIIESINQNYLGWLINLPYFWGILIISLFVTLLTTIVYKYASNQKELKRIKEDMKKFQDEAKKYAKTNPKKAMDIQKKMFALSAEQMKHSFSSMLYTFIPVILIFAWLSASLAYEPIKPNTEFDVTIYAENVQLSAVPELRILKQEQSFKLDSDLVSQYTLMGAQGKYAITVEKAGEKQTFEIVLSENQNYYGPSFLFKNSVMKKAVVSNKEVTPFGDDFSIFGWHPGWLGTYLILSIVFSLLLRKVMNVY